MKTVHMLAGSEENGENQTSKVSLSSESGFLFLALHLIAKNVQHTVSEILDRDKQ